MSSESFTFVTTAIQVAFISIGLIGSLITIIIFLRKTFRNNSISTYCISKALFESLIIFELINDIGYLNNNTYLIHQSEAGCKLFSMISMFITSITPFIMVAFSVDKLLSMRTNSMQILKKKWFQWSLVSISHSAIYLLSDFIKMFRSISWLFCM